MKMPPDRPGRSPLRHGRVHDCIRRLRRATAGLGVDLGRLAVGVALALRLHGAYLTADHVRAVLAGERADKSRVEELEEPASSADAGRRATKLRERAGLRADQGLPTAREARSWPVR